jgi:hypothetical protein
MAVTEGEDTGTGDGVAASVGDEVGTERVAVAAGVQALSSRRSIMLSAKNTLPRLRR